MKVRNKRATAVMVDPKNGHAPFLVEAGDTAEVSDKVGRSLLEQPDRWGPAGPTKVDASVDSVLAQVGGDKNRARTALEKERASDKPRSTLVDALSKIIESEED